MTDKALQQYLSHRVILITGASSGIGLELARRLAQYSVKLVIAARNLPALNVLKKEIGNNKKAEILCVKCDVAKKIDCANLIKKTFEKFKNIDIMIANAGVTMWQKFCDVKDPDELKRVMDINYQGNVYLTYYLMQHFMQKSQKVKKIFTDKPKVFYISSLQSIIGIPFHSGYTASKHALAGFSKALSLEQANISITNVILAWVRGTNLRKSSVGDVLVTKSKESDKLSDAEPSKKKWFSISKVINNLLVTDIAGCVEGIIKELPGNKRDVFLPKISFLVPWFYFFFPGWVKKKTKKITEREKSIGV